MRISHPRTRTLIAIGAMLMPARVRRFMHCRLLGYEIDPSAEIGRSLIDVDAFRAGPGAIVMSMSAIRGHERVELGAESLVGPFNLINAVRRTRKQYFKDLPRETAFIMGRGAGITMLHFIDCCDRVEFGEFSTLGGLMSQFLTHAIDHRSGKQRVAPITIGPYCHIGTRSVFLPGAEVGDRCVIAAGSVVRAGSYDGLTLYGGVPVAPKAKLDPEAKYFTRTSRIVW